MVKPATILANVLIFISIFSPIVSANSDFTENNDLQDLHIVPFQNTGVVQIQVGGKRELDVYHEVRQNDLFVECFVNHFSFNHEKAGALHQEGEGHIRLYINDEHVGTLYEPAFLIEDLSSGEYEIRVVVVKNDLTSYELEESFVVTIN
ncbi:hypothetical protein [Halalkalibacter okhensis]|uniref:Uncharacterized protein n=1 Tax=Halalkalibacter okhensis TaxID=333138 RepID=A0A0B0IDZ8_9BACI|nr:hypothetical protein [Halalkalibacter okhensis]KHF40808.1 hypothetical protein LQ50_06845 [Halalkalibacter okhensis]